MARKKDSKLSVRSHSPVLDQEIEIQSIRMWISSSVGKGGSSATFSHHGSGKWMGNGWPWTKWCYPWIPRARWDIRTITRCHEFMKYSGLTTPNKGSGNFVHPRYPGMMMKQGIVFFEQLLFMFQGGDFEKARNSVKMASFGSCIADKIFTTKCRWKRKNSPPKKGTPTKRQDLGISQGVLKVPWEKRGTSCLVEMSKIKVRPFNT